MCNPTVSKRLSPIAFSLMLAIHAAYAEPVKLTEGEEREAGIRIGGGSTRVQPSLEGKVESRSNFYYSARNEKSALGFLLTPGIRVLTGDERTKVAFGGNLVAAAHDTSSKDDFLDVNLGLQTLWTPTNRLRFGTEFAYLHGHDPFGQNRTDTAVAPAVRNQDLDLWDVLNAGLTYRYGTPEAKFNVEAGLGVFNKAYSTNRAFTRTLDYFQPSGRLSGYFNVSDKTAIVLEEIIEGTDFKNSGAIQRDAVEYKTRTGISYQATEKTRADVRVGYYQRQFETAGVRDQNGFDYAVGVTLAPETHYSFNIEAARSSVPGYIDAVALANQVTFNDTDSLLVGWQHEWTQLFKTATSLKFTGADFIQANGASPRRDNIADFTLRGDYSVTRHATVFGSYFYTDRQSNVAAADYSNHVLTVGLNYNFY